jgi:flagellum-specific peptidoglycan hydrolase FlgJ
MISALFIAKIRPGAQIAQKKRGILASLTIAQAILESGWGGHAPGNNLFGIKANGTTGKTQILRTREVIGGKSVYINAVFRAYDSWAQSVDDHAVFLTRNSRYKNLIGKTDYREVCGLIQRDGYATAPDYSTSLVALIVKYKLYKYDAQPVKKAA